MVPIYIQFIKTLNSNIVIEKIMEKSIKKTIKELPLFIFGENSGFCISILLTLVLLKISTKLFWDITKQIKFTKRKNSTGKMNKK